MSAAAMIVSIIAVIGALILATNNSRFRSLGKGRAIRLALIWVAIIVGLVVVIQLTGFRVEQ